MRGLLLVVSVVLQACMCGPSVVIGGKDGGGGGSANGSGGGAGGASTSGGSSGGGTVADAGCVNLACRQDVCDGGTTTRVLGRVVAPTAMNPDPLPNVTVYVPNAPVTAFTDGARCSRCGEELLGSPLVQAKTNTDGTFVLGAVPSGANVPIVIQSGQWRRQFTVPMVEACGDTRLPTDLAFPRRRSEGDLPKMALVSGSVDALECTLAKLIDPAEVTAPTGAGRVHLYHHNGNDLMPSAPSRATLVGSLSTLMQYDAVLLPCPSHEAYGQQEADNLKAYADQGGRLFATHGGAFWMFEPSSQYGSMIQFNNQPDPSVRVGEVDRSFPKGVTFASWLVLVGASTTAGTLPLGAPQWFVDSVRPPAQRWVSTMNPTTIQHLTFNTPISAPESQQCGRVVFSNFHAGGSTGVGVFPSTCVAGPLSNEEKIIEYMLFDVTACVQPDIQ